MFKITKKVLTLFDKRQKKILIGIMILMLIGAGLETFGVALVVPLMTLILDNNFYMENQYARWFCSVVNINSARTFMLVVILCMIAIYILKNVFIFLEYYIQQIFIQKNRIRIQKKVLAAILERKYEYFLNESTSNIIRIVTDDITGTFGVLNSLLDFYTEGIICIIVFLAVFKINMMMSVLVGIVLLGELMGIIKCIKPIMNRIGKAGRKATKESYKWVMQSVSGIKEIKVADKLSFFLKQYEQTIMLAAKLGRNNHLLMNLPRLIIESVTVSAMLLVLLVLLMRGMDVKIFMPQLAAFAVAAVRILPSANRISTARNNISYQEPSLDALLASIHFLDNDSNNISEEIEYRSENDTKEIAFKRDCELMNISYAYPNSDRYVLENVSMRIAVGTSVGLIGTSGGGKTTTVDILLGLLKPQSGKVLVDGYDIENHYLSWLRHISYIPQTIFLLDDTICTNVAFGIASETIDYDMVWKALEEAKLKEFVLSLPEGIDTIIGERGIRLSGGQRQRIGIARALYSNPELLIFDEATSALDNETETAVMESINALHGNKTMIIIAHRLTTIENCDIIYRIESGKITRER